MSDYSHALDLLAKDAALELARMDRRELLDDLQATARVLRQALEALDNLDAAICAVRVGLRFDDVEAIPVAKRMVLDGRLVDGRRLLRACGYVTPPDALQRPPLLPGSER